jgi:hypothetical protein
VPICIFDFPPRPLISTLLSLELSLLEDILSFFLLRFCLYVCMYIFFLFAEEQSSLVVVRGPELHTAVSLRR